MGFSTGRRVEEREKLLGIAKSWQPRAVAELFRLKYFRSAAEGATPTADRQPLRNSCGFLPGEPPFGDGEFRREENPERAKASADAPSGFLASGAAGVRFARRTLYFVLGFGFGWFAKFGLVVAKMM